MSELLFYDIETFQNYFLIVGQKMDSEEFFVLENPSCVELMNFINEGRLIGFNNHRFDDVILASMMNRVMTTGGDLHAELNPKHAYDMAQEIISSGADVFFEGLRTPTEDLMKYRDFETNALNLKSFENVLMMDILETPVPFDKILTDEEKELVLQYCKNDVIATKRAYEFQVERGSVESVTMLRNWVARELQIEPTQLVKSSVNSMMIKLLDDVEYDRNYFFRYIDSCNFDYIRQDTEFMTWLKEITNWVDNKEKTEYLASSAPKLEIVRHGVTYTFASGGVHGLNEDEKVCSNVKHSDFASLYPNIMIHIRALGTATSKYEEIVKTRITYKSTNKSMANGLKLAVNSLYGLTRSKTSGAHLYDPYVGLDVCILGQMLSYELALRIVDAGGTMINVNTDGLIYKTNGYDSRIADVIREFEETVRISMDTTDLPYLVQKDVNNYFVLDESFEVMKRKGVFSKKPFYNNYASSRYVIERFKHYFKGDNALTDFEELFELYPEDFIVRCKSNSNFELSYGYKEETPVIGKSGKVLKKRKVDFTPIISLGHQFRGYAVKNGWDLMQLNHKTGKFTEIGTLKTSTYISQYTSNQPPKEQVNFQYYQSIADDLIRSIGVEV